MMRGVENDNMDGRLWSLQVLKKVADHLSGLLPC